MDYFGKKEDTRAIFREEKADFILKILPEITL